MEISSHEAYIEGLVYDVTSKSKRNSMSRIATSANLVDIVLKELQEKTDYSMHISKQNLITYALLNLLDTNVQDSVRYRLNQTKQNPTLAKLLALPKDPRNTQSEISNKKLLNIQSTLTDNRMVLDGVITAVSWLLRDRMGMDYSGPAKSSEEAYAKLRDDQLKQIIDEVYRAGVNEHDRQRHLDNI